MVADTPPKKSPKKREPSSLLLESSTPQNSQIERPPLSINSALYPSLKNDNTPIKESPKRPTQSEEKPHSNKFDLLYQIPNDNPKEAKDPNTSQDSANDSTSFSFEEFSENYLNNPFINQRSNKKFNKPKQKVPFQGHANDFKVKYKTELCKYFQINGYCKYGENCAYAHGTQNLRPKVTNSVSYRTKKCFQFFDTGYCPYGYRCQFGHQLQSNIINNPYDKNMSYQKILEMISKLENVGNIKELIEKPRLDVFKDNFDNKDNIKSNLLEDIKALNSNDLKLFKRGEEEENIEENKHEDIDENKEKINEENNVENKEENEEKDKDKEENKEDVIQNDVDDKKDEEK